MQRMRGPSNRTLDISQAYGRPCELPLSEFRIERPQYGPLPPCDRKRLAGGKLGSVICKTVQTGATGIRLADMQLTAGG